MAQKLSGDNFAQINLNPNGKQTGTLQSSVSGLVVAGLGRLLNNCADEAGVALKILEKKYKFLLHETIFFSISGTESQMYTFQKNLSRALAKNSA